MEQFREYPENRLDIRVDENGKVSYKENPEFAKYYAPTREELEEELEELRDEMANLCLDEPEDILGIEHEDWEGAVSDLEERIRNIEEAISDFE